MVHAVSFIICILAAIQIAALPLPGGTKRSRDDDNESHGPTKRLMITHRDISSVRVQDTSSHPKPMGTPPLFQHLNNGKMHVHDLTPSQSNPGVDPKALLVSPQAPHHPQPEHSPLWHGAPGHDPNPIVHGDSSSSKSPTVIHYRSTLEQHDGMGIANQAKAATAFYHCDQHECAAQLKALVRSQDDMLTHTWEHGVANRAAEVHAVVHADNGVALSTFKTDMHQHQR